MDTHIHASQYSNVGKALDLPLLEWLEKYTYPTESSYHDNKVAQDIYRRVVVRIFLIMELESYQHCLRNPKNMNLLCPMGIDLFKIIHEKYACIRYCA